MARAGADHLQLKVVLLQVVTAYLPVTPLQVQQAPATLVELIVVHSALQEPAWVGVPPTKPLVGSIDTVVPVLLNARYGLLG